MVDYFLKIDTVAGDSHDAQHRDEIDVLAFSWGETHAGPPASGSGSGAGKVQIDYRPQKANGSLGTAIHAGWDVKLNKEV